MNITIDLTHFNRRELKDLRGVVVAALSREPADPSVLKYCLLSIDIVLDSNHK